MLCKHITADRRLKVFGTQKNKLKLINESSFKSLQVLRQLEKQFLFLTSLKINVCFFICKFLQGLKCTVCENECEILIVCGYCIGFV